MLGDLPFGRNGLLVSKGSFLPALFVAAVCLSGSWKVERWSFRSQVREEGTAAPSLICVARCFGIRRATGTGDFLLENNITGP